MKTKFCMMFFVPVLILLTLSLYFDMNIIVLILLSILLYDLFLALFRTDKFKYLDDFYLLEIKLPYNMVIPFFGYVLYNGKENHSKALKRLKQSRETGYIFWYVLYLTEYILHFITLTILFRRWYYEEYRGEKMNTIITKIKTIHQKANENVCFNEIGFECSKYEWLKYLLNETKI